MLEDPLQCMSVLEGTMTMLQLEAIPSIPEHKSSKRLILSIRNIAYEK